MVIESTFFLASVPVPINILSDDLIERDEDFRLELISQHDNPSTGFVLGPHVNTRVEILDDDGDYFIY